MFSINVRVPLCESIAPKESQNKTLYSTSTGIQFDCQQLHACITATNNTGCFAVFGGMAVTEDEARQWLDAFEQKGSQFLKDIHKPVWVFAHHPLRRETLVSVDRYRINWIYWTIQNNILYASSSIRELLSSTHMPLELDYNALYSYIDLLCVSADQSIQRGVKKLSGGHCLRVYQGKLDILQYNTFSYEPKNINSEDNISIQIRNGINTSIKRHLAWVEPQQFGCFLSGGTDSSSLLGCISLEKGEGIPAYSVSFSENAWDEMEYASLAAQAFKAKHTIIRFEMDDALRIADLLPSAYDEPMGNPSLLATYKCVEIAAQDGIHFLIAGDGGDEIFGGNERYAINAIYDRFQRSMPPLVRTSARHFFGALSSFTGSNKLLRIKRILDRMDCPNPKRYYLDDAFAYKIFPQAFTRHFAEQIDPEINLKIFTSYYNGSDAITEIDRLLHIDMRHTLGDNDLVKVGISGMANKIGILYPMLDDDLVNTVCHLPGWAKLNGHEKRYLFKKAMSTLVPEKILYKKKKGFGVPISQWLIKSQRFTNRLTDVVFDSSGLAREIFTPIFLEQLFKEHQQGTTNNGMLLWGLYSLNKWASNAKQWFK